MKDDDTMTLNTLDSGLWTLDFELQSLKLET